MKVSATGLIIASPASGQGKTLVTAGIVRALLRRGRSVRLYKMGPDYLDPLFLENATGLTVRQLDYWLLGEREIAAELARAAAEADHIIVEGMMGLFDGDFPVARLAREFGFPVLAVVDAQAMAQTFGAVVHGLAAYDGAVRVAAVIANRVGSDGHGEMLRGSVRPPVRFLGYVRRDEALAVEQRHLGIDTLGRHHAEAVAQAMAEHLDAAIDALPWGALSLGEAAIVEPSQQRLKGLRAAVARDAAFSFLYHANVDFLQRQGAQVTYFSPVKDRELPACDVLYLPGGYPELHLAELSANTGMRAAVRAHIESDKPCIAECGGMLYLLRELGFRDQRAPMVGVLPGSGTVQSALAAIGYQQLPRSDLRGHTFHHAEVECELEGQCAEYPGGRQGEAIYRYRNTVASFVHWYFASDDDTVAGWLKPSL